jgi:hypothetical protein
VTQPGAQAKFPGILDYVGGWLVAAAPRSLKFTGLTLQNISGSTLAKALIGIFS